MIEELKYGLATSNWDLSLRHFLQDQLRGWIMVSLPSFISLKAS